MDKVEIKNNAPSLYDIEAFKELAPRRIEKLIDLVKDVYGIDDKELADMLEMSPGWLTRCRNGGTEVWRFDKIIKLCELVGDIDSHRLLNWICRTA